MIMGFHYSLQFGRRMRLKILDSIYVGGYDFENWYKRMHTENEIKKIAEAGYNVLETHFLYGFGLKSEMEEVDLTKKLVKNCHKLGIKVLGYFQFFSVQAETFFLYHPWAESMLQLDEDKKPYRYSPSYNRIALCFSHPKVQKYYLDGIEVGLYYCDLDGIRLDNDYYQGCYCQNCLSQFRKYLKEKFDERECKRIFGISTLDGVQFPSIRDVMACNDPLWMEMVKFRQIQRQQIMRLIYNKVKSIKKDAILGGNPAVCRRPDQVSLCNVYIPDLGETHDLVCVENLLFPRSFKKSICHQAEIYQHGNSSGFKVFASHHLLNKDGTHRFPENSDEVMLSLCESLAYGGHYVSTTWGMRMDQGGKSTLYERPYYLNPFKELCQFLDKYPYLYDGSKHDVQVGIYMNRESLFADFNHSWNSLQGLMQILLQNKIPFSFVYGEKLELLNNIDLLIVPDIRLMKEGEIKALEKFLESKKGIFTGESCIFDEYFLERDENTLNRIRKNKNLLWLKDTPEKLDFEKGFKFRPNKWLLNTFLPPKSEEMVDAIIFQLGKKRIFTIKSTIFLTCDLYKGKDNSYLLHLLNYKNNEKCQVVLSWKEDYKKIEVFSPEKGISVNADKNSKRISVKGLKTYAVLKIV